MDGMLLAVVLVAGCGGTGPGGTTGTVPETSAGPAGTGAAARPASDLLDPRETHLRNLRQLTFGGENADGSDPRQITQNGQANFAPFFFPRGDRIIFVSNVADPGGRNFDIWAVGSNGGGLERVTYYDGFDGFSMFSPDGRRLVFASNRGGKVRGETNLFVADWVE